MAFQGLGSARSGLAGTDIFRKVESFREPEGEMPGAQVDLLDAGIVFGIFTRLPIITCRLS